eukprot:4755916-Amphidinium_carterae.1
MATTTTTTTMTNATTTAETTTTTTLGVVDGQVEFSITADNASAADIVDQFNANSSGTVVMALQNAIAAGSDNVDPADVTITNVSLAMNTTMRRLEETSNLRSSRMLTAATGA